MKPIKVFLNIFYLVRIIETCIIIDLLKYLPLIEILTLNPEKELLS